MVVVVVVNVVAVVVAVGDEGVAPVLYRALS